MLVETDVCEAMNPCQNGGTCVANGTNYNCECDEGYSGINCTEGNFC